MNGSEGDFIVRLIKEASGLDGEIKDYKITLSIKPVPTIINLTKLLKLKHSEKDFNTSENRD